MSAEDPAKFRRFNITKMELPAPFWSDARAAKYREMYGGEDSVGWQTNVLGKWGSPSYSVFPMPTLKPNLKFLPHYRIVVASVDRENRRLSIRAARLSADSETVEGGKREELLLRDERAFLDGKDLGDTIARYFPDVSDWKDPALYCGGDLGSAADPTELLFVRRVGIIWSDVFRLHLVNAGWPEQAEVIAYLDHASGHVVKYGFDNGSAGSALVQVLCEMEQFRTCPVCRTQVVLSERLHAFGFGDHCDEIDVETGEPILNPDKKDAAGNPMAHRLSNKEFSTRVLERKTQAVQLAIANDAGADDQRIAAAQLLVNHTSSGVTARGERRFKGQDDHAIDARRQVALRIASEVRGDPWFPADPELLVTTRGVDDPPNDGFGPEGAVGSGFDIEPLGNSRIFSGEDW